MYTHIPHYQTHIQMNLPRRHILRQSRDTNSRRKCAAMAFVVFIPALLNEEATNAPAHGDDLARRHTADLRSVGASWLRCMLGLAADAAAHMLRRVWCHAEKICFDGSSCRSKVRGTGVNRMVRGGRQRHGLPMEHWCSGRRDPSVSADHRTPTGFAGSNFSRNDETRRQ